jgi:hypothetical protein
MALNEKNVVATEFTGDASKLATGAQQGAKAVGDFGKASTQAQQGVSELIQRVTGLNPAMLGVAGAVTTAGLAIINSTKHTIDLGSRLVDLRGKTGISVEGLQELEFAATQSGSSLDVVSNAVVQLGRRVAEPSKALVAALGDIGVRVQEIANLSPEERFLRVADALAKIENPAKQAQVAMELFGKAGISILPVVNDNAREAVDRFRELGATMSSETAQAADDLGDRLDELGVRWTGIKNVVGGLVIPVITGFLDVMQLTIGGVTALAAHFVESFGGIANILSQFQYAIGLVVPGATATGDALQDLRLSAVALSNDLRESADKTFRDVTTRLTETSEGSKRLADDFEGIEPPAEKAAKAVAGFNDELARLSAFEEQIATQRHYETIQRNAEAYVQEQREIAAATAEMAPYMAAAQATVAANNAKAKAAGEATTKITELALEEEKSVDVTKELADVFSEARGLMTLFGIDAESTAGKIINAFSKVFDVFNSVLGIISKIAGVFGGGGFNLGSLFGIGGSATSAATGGGLLGSLFGIGGGGAAAAAGTTAAAGGVAAAGGTAAAGGAAAGGLGISALAATGYGALAAAAIFAIRAALKKASAETTAEFLGIDFDVLSEGLQDTLQDMGKQLGDFSTALQLNLGQVFREGGLGKNFDLLAEKAADTFSFLDRGQIDAAQAQQVLNDVTAEMLPVIDQMGAEGVLQLERLLAAAERTGVSFSGMEELAKAYVERANELGIAVNNVVLEALGLDEALAVFEAGNAATAEGGAAAEGLGAIADQAAAATDEVNALIDALREAAGAKSATETGAGASVIGAQHGFDATVLGPRTFSVEPGLREHVSISRDGAPAQAQQTVVNLTVDARGSFGLDGRAVADAITRMIEQNLSGAQVRLQKALGVEG